MANPELNEMETLGVKIEPARVGLGETYWRVVGVHPLLTLDEGGETGRRFLAASALDEHGKAILGARLRVAWPGGEEIIAAPAEKGAIQEVNFTLAPGRTYTLEPADVPGERVIGLSDELLGDQSEESSNAIRVVWQRAVKKIFAHYVLFGSAQDPQTRANMIIALGYILRFKPAFGFRVEEAELAERVTIIGGPGSVSFDVQERLEAAGCWVYRIEGDGRAIDRVLGELQKSGQPFAS